MSNSAEAIAPQSWFQRIFVNRNIFNLLTGQVISQTGDSIFEIALLWLLLELTGSSRATGFIAMAGYLPALLFGLFAGALVDRFDRRRLMIWSDILRFGLVLLIPLLFYLDGLNGAVLAVLTFLIATFNTLFNPARDAMVGQLVAPNQRLAANGLIQTSWQYAAFFGPAFAGAILAIVGEVHLFTLDAFTFLLSAYFIYRIVSPNKNTTPSEAKPTDTRKALRSGIDDVIAGLRFAKKDKRIVALLIMTAINNLLLMGPAIIGAPIFIREILNGGVEQFAFVQITYAIGMVTATIWLNRYGARYRNSRLLLWGLLFDGLTLVPLLWVENFSMMFLVMTIHALALPMIIVTRPTIIQNLVPDEMQGRVFSMISVGVFGFTTLSIAATGIMAEIIPINQLFAVVGILAALTSLIGWSIKSFRELDDTPIPEAQKA